jgi:hypothetical protein
MNAASGCGAVEMVVEVRVRVFAVVVKNIVIVGVASCVDGWRVRV